MVKLYLRKDSGLPFAEASLKRDSGKFEKYGTFSEWLSEFDRYRNEDVLAGKLNPEIEAMPDMLNDAPKTKKIGSYY